MKDACQLDRKGLRNVLEYFCVHGLQMDRLEIGSAPAEGGSGLASS